MITALVSEAGGDILAKKMLLEMPFWDKLDGPSLLHTRRTPQEQHVHHELLLHRHWVVSETPERFRWIRKGHHNLRWHKGE